MILPLTISSPPSYFRKKGDISRLCLLHFSIFNLDHKGTILSSTSGLKYRETDKPHHDYVFYDFNGEPLNRGAVSRIFIEISKISGIQVYCYRCRYTFAVNLWMRGVDIFVISKKLGHKNIETTMRYLKVQERMVDHSYRETLERRYRFNPNTARINPNLALYNSINWASRF